MQRCERPAPATEAGPSDNVAAASSLLVLAAHCRTGYNEVFSPGIQTQSKGAVGAAGQGGSESSATPAPAHRPRCPLDDTRSLASACR